MDESTLFNLIKTKLIPDLESTDKYNPTDATSIKYQMVIELKCRSYCHRHLMLEKSKYDKLIQYKNPRYINSIPNGVDNLIFFVYSFDISKLKEPVWQLRWCKQTTQFGPVKYIRKLVTFLDRFEGKDITNKLF